MNSSALSIELNSKKPNLTTLDVIYISSPYHYIITRNDFLLLFRPFKTDIINNIVFKFHCNCKIIIYYFYHFVFNFLW